MVSCSKLVEESNKPNLTSSNDHDVVWLVAKAVVVEIVE